MRGSPSLPPARSPVPQTRVAETAVPVQLRLLCFGTLSTQRKTLNVQPGLLPTALSWFDGFKTPKPLGQTSIHRGPRPPPKVPFSPNLHHCMSAHVVHSRFFEFRSLAPLAVGQIYSDPPLVFHNEKEQGETTHRPARPTLFSPWTSISTLLCKAPGVNKRK